MLLFRSLIFLTDLLLTYSPINWFCIRQLHCDDLQLRLKFEADILRSTIRGFDVANEYRVKIILILEVRSN